MDNKTKELIAIGAAVTANCVPCFKFHFAKAREEEANDDEIREARLEVVDCQQRRVVTVIEVLSPTILTLRSTCKSS